LRIKEQEACQTLHEHDDDDDIIVSYIYIAMICRSKRWGTCFRHCATSWKDAGSIPDGVIGIFQ